MRGYDRTGFFEVDTGKDAKSWTVQLTDQANIVQSVTRPILDASVRETGMVTRCGGAEPNVDLSPRGGAYEFRRSRRVKIIATLGPASADRETSSPRCSRPAPTSSAST